MKNTYFFKETENTLSKIWTRLSEYIFVDTTSYTIRICNLNYFHKVSLSLVP